MDKPKHDFSRFKREDFRIIRAPIDSRSYTRWGDVRRNAVGNHDFTVEELEQVIRAGDIDSLRELSRYYYRTNSDYRNNIDFLASLPLYDTVVVPLFEDGTKNSKAQITKAFYNACDFVDKLDCRNTFARITRAWLIEGIYNGILRVTPDGCTVQDLPLRYCRSRFKDLHNLNILEFNLRYFEGIADEKLREEAVLTFPKVIQDAWKKWVKSRKLLDPWVLILPSDGGVSFSFAHDQSPLLIASIPELRKLKDAAGREEKRDENELYKLLIQRMPIDKDGELVFQLDEVADMHASVASMLQDLDTVDVLTTFGETDLEALQDSSAASQSADRIDKYRKGAWDALGRGEILFNANNSSSLAYSIKKDESMMRLYLNMYETWVKYHLNDKFARPGLTFNFEILSTTRFNWTDLQGSYFRGAQYGYSKMYAGVASGIKQVDQISLMNFENDFLKMSEKMVPLQSSYTMPGNSSEKISGSAKTTTTVKTSGNLNNTGGRPELPDELKSEKTQANIAAMG